MEVKRKRGGVLSERGVGCVTIVFREKHFSNFEGEIFGGWVYLGLTHY